MDIKTVEEGSTGLRVAFARRPKLCRAIFYIVLFIVDAAWQAEDARSNTIKNATEVICSGVENSYGPMRTVSKKKIVNIIFLENGSVSIQTSGDASLNQCLAGVCKTILGGIHEDDWCSKPADCIITNNDAKYHIVRSSPSGYSEGLSIDKNSGELSLGGSANFELGWNISAMCEKVEEPAHKGSGR